MKRVLRVMLCFCTMISLLSFSAQAGGLTHLALGDSITTGYGLENAKKECFANLLADELGFYLVNRAVNGNTTSGLMKQLAQPDIQKDVKNAYLITITIGGNDMLALFYDAIINTYNTLSGGAAPLNLSDVGAIMSNPQDQRQTVLMMCAQTVLLGNSDLGMPSFMESDAFKAGLDAYVQALKDIVKIIHEINPGVQVIVATQYNPYAPFTGPLAALNAGFDAGVRQLNQVITQNATAGRYAVTDVYAAFSAAQENLYNACMEPLNLDIHPNAAGHKVIFESFFDTAMRYV